MAVRDHPGDSDYSEYHNLHIGWVEGENNKINSSESQHNIDSGHMTVTVSLQIYCGANLFYQMKKRNTAS